MYIELPSDNYLNKIHYAFTLNNTLFEVKGICTKSTTYIKTDKILVCR